MLIQTDFSVACVRPDSHQLFFLFTGTGLRPAGLQTIDVIARTPLARCNVVLVRDPLGRCYEEGLGGEYGSVEGIVRWQREQIAAHFPHVREVFCVGVSIGGLTAIQTACRLGARAAWSLAGRVLKPDVVDQRLRAMIEVYQRVVGRTRLGQLTPDEERSLRDEFETPALSELRARLADPETIIARDRLRGMAADVESSGAATECHLYCTVSNVIDRECADAFRACPNVTLHYLDPEPRYLEPQVGFSEPDHSIVAILNRLGQWPTLFSAYL